MNFKTCIRCGCFFSSNDSVCPNCKTKDEIDKSSLKQYLTNNDTPKNFESLSYLSGVSVKNINRFLETEEFSSFKDSFIDSNNLTSSYKV